LSEIKQLEAGWELDELVATKMGWTYEPRFEGDTTGYWNNGEERFIFEEMLAFSMFLDDAWIVFNFVMDNYLFSKRRKFLHLLQEQARLENGELPAWPDVLVVLRKRLPHAICLAFLELQVDV
jgi:hypothetical protein